MMMSNSTCAYSPRIPNEWLCDAIKYDIFFGWDCFVLLKKMKTLEDVIDNYVLYSCTVCSDVYLAANRCSKCMS